AQVVHFIAAIAGTPGTHHVRRALARGGYALDHAKGRVLGGGHGEKNLILCVIEFGKREKILFEIGFEAFDRADHGDLGRIESSLCPQAAARHTQPFDALPEAVQPLQELLDKKNIEQDEHLWAAYQNCNIRPQSLSRHMFLRAPAPATMLSRG